MIKKTPLLLILFFLSSTLSAQFFPEKELFSFGSYYYPEQWDESQWDRDLANMAKMGINFTHFAEFAWGRMEPEEGKYDFSWLDKAVSIAEKHRLKIIMCTPTPAPPIWLSKKYPDILIQRSNGVAIQHSRRQHASWSSDTYRKYVSKIVTELARRYGNNKNIIGWQIDNEPGHYGVVDYSENAQRRFRIWLKNKYQTIDNLNKTWGAAFWSETYQDFDQIRMPNSEEVPEKPNPHAMLDMNRFMADEIAEFVNMQADILHKIVRKSQWVTTNIIPIYNPVDLPRVNRIDFPTYTKYMVNGYNNGIGKQGFRIGDPNEISLPNDMFRCSTGNQYGVMELQPGQINWGAYNPQPMPGAVRMWIYHVFAGGSKFVCNYRFRHPLYGSEQYHYGMMMTDGTTLSPGGKEYIQVIKEMEKLRKEYDKNIRMPKEIAKRKTAVLFNMENMWDMDFQKQTKQWSSLNHFKKYYTIAKSFGAPVDIIDESADFQKYFFLIAPAYQLLDDVLVDRWMKYVENGGNLILSCRTAQKDRNGKLWEAPLAAPIYNMLNIQDLFYDHMPSNISGEITFNGNKYYWNNWADVMTTSASNNIWAQYSDQFYQGSAAVVHRKIGKGSVTFIGPDTDNSKLETDVLRRVYTEAGVETENIPYGIVKEWRNGFNIVINYTSDKQQIAVPSNSKIIIGSSQLEPTGVLIWK